MKMKPVLLLLLTCLLPAGLLSGAEDKKAETQFNFATGLLIKNEHALAGDEFEALLRNYPNFTQADIACYRLGEARQKGGQPDAARQAFARLLKDFPASDRAPHAHYWLGQLKSGKIRRPPPSTTPPSWRSGRRVPSPRRRPTVPRKTSSKPATGMPPSPAAMRS